MTNQDNFSNESFEELFKSNVQGINTFQEQIVKGVVIAIDQNFVTIDVGLKSEGKVNIAEFKDAEGKLENIEVGSTVEVYVDRYEDINGVVNLSREKAKREEAWYHLEKLYISETPIVGYITKRVKGGFAVDIDGTQAFLPGSQLDIRAVKNINSLVNTNQTLQILKMDKKRYNIVVSRKAILAKHAENNPELQIKYEEGQIVEGIVKNITPYGAFVDLGQSDALLHITDISWCRINHPSEVLEINGQPIKLKIIKINPENNRISVGLKQLTEDPWGSVMDTYKKDSIHEVKITNITDYGLFVELTPGIEGLVHISEATWSKEDIDLRAEYKIGQITKVKVLEIDPKKRRINLSIKQCTPNPWLAYSEANPEGSIVKVKVKSINDNGLVVSLDTELLGYIRATDISWDNKGKELLNNYKVGDEIDAKIIRYDLEKDRILLSIKHLQEDPFTSLLGDIKKGSVVKGKVIEHTEEGLEVEVEPGIIGIVKKADISVDRDQQNVETYPVGSSIDAVVIQVHYITRTLQLSIKAWEIGKQKEQMTTGADTTSSLGDIFAEALSKKEQESK